MLFMAAHLVCTRYLNSGMSDPSYNFKVLFTALVLWMAVKNPQASASNKAGAVLYDSHRVLLEHDAAILFPFASDPRLHDLPPPGSTFRHIQRPCFSCWRSSVPPVPWDCSFSLRIIMWPDTFVSTQTETLNCSPQQRVSGLCRQAGRQPAIWMP